MATFREAPSHYRADVAETKDAYIHNDLFGQSRMHSLINSLYHLFLCTLCADHNFGLRTNASQGLNILHRVEKFSGERLDSVICAR